MCFEEHLSTFEAHSVRVFVSMIGYNEFVKKWGIWYAKRIR